MSIDLETTFLPKGWKREELLGKPGLSQGKIEVNYYDQKGKRFRNKAEIQKYFGDKIDLSMFDFNSGKINPFLVRKNLKKSKLKQLMVPVRQAPMTLKQKVNLIKTQTDSKVSNELKPINSEKPKQIFWEKRLSSFKTKDDDISLPKNIKTFGPDTDNSTAIRSIAAALQLSGQGIVGQADTKVLDKNPCVFINPDQPLVQALTITDEDIRRQEERVFNARKKLELAFKENLVI